MGCTSSRPMARAILRSRSTSKIPPDELGTNGGSTQEINKTHYVNGDCLQGNCAPTTKCNGSVEVAGGVSFDQVKRFSAVKATQTAVVAVNTELNTPDIQKDAVKTKTLDGPAGLMSTPPRFIEVQDPATPRLTRSVNCFSTTTSKMNLLSTPPSYSKEKMMPSPIVLDSKLVDDRNFKQSHDDVVSLVVSLFAYRFRSDAIKKKPALFTSLFCAMLTFMLHFVTIFGDFVWDDRMAVLGNPDVLGTRSIFPYIFTHDFWGQDMSLDKSHKSYRPLTVLSLRLTNLRTGTESAAGFHLDNVILHSIATYIYSRICFQLAETFIKENQRTVTITAAFASILFAVHPIHTEPVASIVGRSDLLCGCFYLTGIWLYINGRFQPALAMAACGTLSKETGIAVFGVFIASDCIHFWAKKPFIAVKGRHLQVLVSRSIQNVAHAIAVTALHLKLHGKKMIYDWSMLENSISLLESSAERIISYAHVHKLYLAKLFFPWNLSYDYGYPCIQHRTSLDFTTALIPLSFLAFFLIGLQKNNAMLLWSFALTILPFIPVSNIFFPVGTILAERLLYLPSMGFCLGSGYTMASLVNINVNETMIQDDGKVRNWCDRSKTIVKGVSFILLCSYTCVMAMKTVHRSYEWASELTLFKSALLVCPKSLKVLNNYATMFLSDDPQHAIPFLEEAVALYDQYESAHFNLGIAYSNTGRFKDAMKSFKKSLALHPRSNQTRVLLVNAMNNYLLENSRADDSQETAKEALDEIDLFIEESEQKYARPYYLRCALGKFLGHSPKINIQYCKNAVEANRLLKSFQGPMSFLVAEDVVLNMIGLMLKDTGNDEEAIEYFLQGLNANPNSPDILVNLASIYSEKKDYKLATYYFDQAEELISDPQVKSLLMTNKGFSMEKQGYHLTAMAIYKEAINIATAPHPQLLVNLQNIQIYCEQNTCN
eukprot:CCRYP_011415-RA/>CCRYP_011415-RA protein AED:0.21 eAED:0.21 QI:4399/1/1/1/0.33/0.28/7/233/939